MGLKNEMKTRKNMSNHWISTFFFKEEGKLGTPVDSLICCIFPIGNKLNELTFRILPTLYPAHFVWLV